MVDKAKEDPLSTTKGIKMKKEKASFSESDEKCSLNKVKWASIYGKGFVESVNMFKDHLNLKSESFNANWKYSEEVNPETNKKTGIVVLSIFDKSGKEVAKQEINAKSEPIKMSADGCTIPYELKSDIMCIGFKKGFDMMAEITGIEPESYKTGCKVYSENNEFYTLMGIKTKSK